MSECKHKWYSVTREEFKSNPPKIGVFCAKCNDMIYVTVLNHWTEIDKVIEEHRET